MDGTDTCLGGEEFRERMLDLVEERLSSAEHRESYSGPAADQHDERQAERLMRKGLKALGLKEEDLGKLNKGDLRKCALAWHIHRYALVGHRWIAGRLKMGCETALTAYMNRIRNATEGKALHLRRKVECV